MFQELFINEIRRSLSESESLNEAIANALDISYDAAHRRTSLKSKFSLEESIALAQYFNISLDSLYGKVTKNYVSVEKTAQISNEEELCSYFKSSYDSLSELLKVKNGTLYYSAKDIPIFYTLTDNRLSHFKFYVWLKMLDKKYRDRDFESFQPKLDTIYTAKKLGELYQKLPTVEIWDTTTINSTLKQIHFYYKAGQMTSITALNLCSLLKELLNDISVKVISKRKQFKLYYNELLIMNNNVLISSENRQSLYVPFSMLSYYLTSDKETCEQVKKYFDKQLKNSKLLNTSGEKEQNSFYNKMMGKIDALLQLIQAENILDFE